MGWDIFAGLRGLLQKRRCDAGRHQRDASLVRRVDKRWQTTCVGCGVTMIKIDDAWRLRSDVLAAERAADPGVAIR